jgi:hypothetical protein
VGDDRFGPFDCSRAIWCDLLPTIFRVLGVGRSIYRKIGRICVVG